MIVPSVKISREKLDDPAVQSGLYELDTPRRLGKVYDASNDLIIEGQIATIARVDVKADYLPPSALEAYFRPDGARVVIQEILIDE